MLLGLLDDEQIIPASKHLCSECVLVLNLLKTAVNTEKNACTYTLSHHGHLTTIINVRIFTGMLIRLSLALLYFIFTPAILSRRGLTPQIQLRMRGTVG